MENGDMSRPPSGWLEAMDESDEDLAAGRIVALSAVLADLHASLMQAEADQARLAPSHAGAPKEP